MSTVTYGPSKRESIIDKSITSIKSNVAYVGDYAFYGCTNLTSAEFPKATSIGQYAFNGCSKLENCDFSEVHSVGAFAFRQCNSLTEMPTFASNVSFARGVFSACTGLTTVNTSVSCPWDFLNACSNLVTVVMRNTTTSVNIRSFYQCPKLQIADVYGTGFNNTAIFSGCTVFDTLVIRVNSVQALANVNSFQSTPFASGGTGGTIYIPKTLYDALGTGTNDYLANTNWSTLNGYGTITWQPIEGSYYETHYADGTLIAS